MTMQPYGYDEALHVRRRTLLLGLHACAANYPAAPARMLALADDGAFLLTLALEMAERFGDAATVADIRAALASLTRIRPRYERGDDCRERAA